MVSPTSLICEPSSQSYGPMILSGRSWHSIHSTAMVLVLEDTNRTSLTIRYDTMNT
jgi:hypothetical protein